MQSATRPGETVTPNRSKSQRHTLDLARAGHRLRALRNRAGLTVASVAEALEMNWTTYKSNEDRYRKGYLDPDLVRRIAPLLIGQGEPPITAAEVQGLAPRVDLSRLAYDSGNARIDHAAPLPVATRRDVPLLPTRSAGWGALMIQPNHNPIGQMPRTQGIEQLASVLVLTVADASLSPRYDPGERIYCDPDRPPPIGGFAAVFLQPSPSGEQIVHLGRLVGMSATLVTIESLNPPSSIDLAQHRIQRIGRILTTQELVG